MYDYLEKEALYNLIESIQKDDLPDISLFGYSRFDGVEWLESGDWYITSQCGGGHISVRHKIFDYTREGFHTDLDTYIIRDGKVIRHYQNYELKSLV